MKNFLNISSLSLCLFLASCGVFKKTETVEQRAKEVSSVVTKAIPTFRECFQTSAKELNLPSKEYAIFLKVLVLGSGAVEDVEIENGVSPSFNSCLKSTTNNWAFSKSSVGDYWYRQPMVFLNK